MPAATGVNFVLKIGNDVQTVTITGGAGTDTYKLAFGGQVTTAIQKSASAATVQSALTALSTIGAGNVAVTGTGPYTVTFQGALAGQNVDLLVSSNLTGTISAVTIARGTPSWQTLGGQRDAQLQRTVDEVNLTSKDSSGWHDGAPVIRNVRITAGHLAIESGAALQALDYVYTNQAKVHVQLATPAGNTYTGVGTLAQWNFDGPYTDGLTGSCEVMIAGVLTKA